MKIFHTADWHLGKIVQGVYMTNDQKYILQAFIKAIEEEKPDVVVIAGDLYDRGIPPTEAVHLLDETLEKIVMDLKTPVIAIAGNHDSPSRLHFGSGIMKQNGFHIVGNFTSALEPVVMNDEYGEVHFHLVPYCDPSIVRNQFDDDTIRTHQDATKKIVDTIEQKLDPNARHVYVGHAFVTPFGETAENTSESERPLAIGGAEHVDAHLFHHFHYTALGHLHQAHYVLNETIQYAGSIMKYSISEEKHKKGFFVVELEQDGSISREKRLLTPIRDIRTVQATMDELLTHDKSDDYVFVHLLDTTPVLSPMEKIRSIYPNAMHVTRKIISEKQKEHHQTMERSKMSDTDLFKAFYKEVKGTATTDETIAIFNEVLNEFMQTVDQ